LPETKRETADSAREIDVAALREMVDKANQMMAEHNPKLMFSVYEDTGTQLIQVFDRDTEELIREYPPEDYLQVVKHIQELTPDQEVAGVILQEQA
jgi:flagellar protein FlaG